MFDWKLCCCLKILSGTVAPFPQTGRMTPPLRGWAINNKKWCPHNVGPFSPLSASTFVQPFFPDPPFCQAQDGPQAKPKSTTCVQDFLYFSESHSLLVCAGGGGEDHKKRGIVASRTRCPVPPTLKSPIDEGFSLPYRHIVTKTHRNFCCQSVYQCFETRVSSVIGNNLWSYPLIWTLWNWCQ